MWMLEEERAPPLQEVRVITAQCGIPRWESQVGENHQETDLKGEERQNPSFGAFPI